MSGVLQPGYKQTEIGVIPEDWSTQKLKDAVEFLDGRRRPVKDSDRSKMRGDFPYYGASGIVDYVNNFLFDDELILLGEDGENILSRNRRLAFKVSGKNWVNNHAHVLKPKLGHDIDFLAEYLESLNYEQYNTGTAQPKLNKLICSNIPIACPPLEEQRAIAAALGDVDALIASLDQLIIKKRDLKQAAMQQLLTGKQRLPGFSGEWKSSAIKEVASVTKGVQLSSSRINSNGRFAHLNGGITPSSYTEQSNTPANTIAISEGGNSCGFVQLMKEAYWCGGHCYSVIPNGIDNEFLYHALKNQQLSIMGLRVGSGLPNVQKTALLAFKFEIPTDKKEQTAIAGVLSDLDAELSALEAQRDKTRVLKQGMMQELLTGKTRLL